MRRHNLWGKKLICAVLCASLILPAAGCAQGRSGDGAAGSGSVTAGTEQGGSGDGAGGSGSVTAGTEQAVSGNEGGENTILSAGWHGKTAVPGEKEETVYVKADPYGRPKETTVEVILSKIAGTDPVEDRSDLADIKNTEGDEEYLAKAASCGRTTARTSVTRGPLTRRSRWTLTSPITWKGRK